ncbi:MAG: TM0106 family RecB-like putative nuclease, partial [Candidatus Hodarchaeota archaeon]
MLFTNDLIEAFINCNYKYYLKSNGESGKISDFEKYYKRLKKRLLIDYIKRISANKSNYRITKSAFTPELLAKGFDFIFNCEFKFKYMRYKVDCLQKVKKNLNNANFSYIPIYVYPNDNITKADKLKVTCLGLSLKRIRGIETQFGKIIYGREFKYSKVYYSKLAEDARAIRNKIRLKTIPKIYLNKHCNICEFNKFCKEKALEADNLSLLSGITSKEIDRYNKKGIFTVKQLSYTFKARRKRNKSNNYKKPHSYELKALAIRDKKIYVHETPQLPKANVNIYFDIEGLPDKNFQYLLGLIIQEGNNIDTHSFWANSKDDENFIFRKFHTLLNSFTEYNLFHYGSYELRYLKKMYKKSNNIEQEQIEKVLNSCCNILSFLYANIYLPTYTNSLKDVANYIGFKWTERNASGIQSIIWRKEWEETQKEELKNKLVLYNKEDCFALMRVKNFLYSIIDKKNINNGNLKLQETVYPEELKKNSIFSFQDKNFALPEMELINNYSYFDYFKERVHVRTQKRSK